MEQFRQRLVDFRSYNDIEKLIKELWNLELDEERILPFFVVRSVLEGVRDALADRPVETATWNQVKEELSEPMRGVVDAHGSGDRAILWDRLSTLCRRWRLLQKELAHP